MSNLHAAHREWASRPADERYPNFLTLHADALRDKRLSKEAGISGDRIRVEARRDDVWLRCGAQGAPLTEWAFGQVARVAGAPPGYLATLSPTTAAAALNEGLDATRGGRGDYQALVRGGKICALNGPRYSRVYDADVLDMVAPLTDRGWRPPPALARHGSPNAGLYRGQRDMFTFLVNEEHRVDDGTEGGLGRGFFLWNSEVGARSFGISTFLYRYVCGNHIVWGATDVVESRLRHVGSIGHRARAEVHMHLSAWAQASTAEVEAQISTAQRVVLGKGKDEVVRATVRATGLPQSTVSSAWDGASQWVEVDGTPDTAWGMAQALTRYSQSSSWTSDRVEIDQKAGQLLRVVLS